MKKIIRWIPALTWMGFIFYLSSQNGFKSGQLSEGVLYRMLSLIKGLLPSFAEDAVNIETLHHIIRKNAHFIAYFILGMLISIPLVKNHKRYYWYRAYAICVLYALSDEIHQLFVPGRAGQLKDVIIDSCGALFGVLLFAWMHRKFSDRKYNIC